MLSSQLSTFFILDQKSHYRYVSPLLHQDIRQLLILIQFLRNYSKAYNLLMAEEHVPYTWYTGKTDGERSRSQEYLTFASQKINTIDPIPSPVSIKQGLQTTEYRLRITDYGLRTTDYGLRTTDYGLRTTDYGLRTTDYGLQTTDWV